MKSVRLTEAQRKMYEKEKEYNFRHIARLLCSHSRHTLTASEIISDDDSSPSNSNAGPSTSAAAAAASESAVRASKLATELATWGEFAEIAHGDVDPAFVLREIDALSEPGYPYHEYYRTLMTPGVQFLGVFRGPGKEGVQGYVALRPGVGRAGNDEVIIAFSGTCCVWQVFQDMDVRRAVYSGPSHSHSSSKDPGIQGQHGSSENGKERGNEEPKGDREEKKPRAYVHRGFWRLYTAMRPSMSKVLASALEKHPTADLVITGHSLGGAMCYLLALDVLLKSPELANGNAEGRKITLAAFGCPRVGDAALVKIFNDAAAVYRKEYGAEKFHEYSVKAFDDGAHCLPQHGLGYRHMCQTPFYLYQGNLYRVPAGDSESSFFNVEPAHPKDGIESVYPLGGHNYYNNRNMEKPLILVRMLKMKTLGEEGWKERYLKILKRV